jgi:hypothetical protein
LEGLFCGWDIASPLLRRAGSLIKFRNQNWDGTEEKTALGGPLFGSLWMLTMLSFWQQGQYLGL